jgi:hypothetical protein
MQEIRTEFWWWNLLGYFHLVDWKVDITLDFGTEMDGNGSELYPVADWYWCSWLFDFCYHNIYVDHYIRKILLHLFYYVSHLLNSLPQALHYGCNIKEYIFCFTQYWNILIKVYFKIPVISGIQVALSSILNHFEHDNCKQHHISVHVSFEIKYWVVNSDGGR